VLLVPMLYVLVVRLTGSKTPASAAAPQTLTTEHAGTH